MPAAEFDEAMQTEDQLIFLYVFDSEQDKSTQLNE
jgi:hypothetical protein